MKKLIPFLSLVAVALPIMLISCSRPNTVTLSASASSPNFLQATSTTLNVTSTSSQVVLTGSIDITSGTFTIYVRDPNGNTVSSGALTYSCSSVACQQQINEKYTAVTGNWTLGVNPTGAQGSYSVQLSF